MEFSINKNLFNISILRLFTSTHHDCSYTKSPDALNIGGFLNRTSKIVPRKLNYSTTNFFVIFSSTEWASIPENNYSFPGMAAHSQVGVIAA